MQLKLIVSTYGYGTMCEDFLVNYVKGDFYRIILLLTHKSLIAQCSMNNSDIATHISEPHIYMLISGLQWITQHLSCL